MDWLHNGQARTSRGAALVEFCIVALLLLMIVFGILEFGLLMKDYLAINHAAREGARVAAVGEPTSTIMARVMASASVTGVTESDVVLQKSVSGSGAWSTLGNNGQQNDAAPGDYVRVNIMLHHEWVTAFFSSSETMIQSQMVTRRE